MQASQEFWEFIDRLIADSHIVIDRQRGSSHPRYADYVYPLDYGLLEGTSGPDGAGIDIWVGSRREPAASSLAVTIDLVKRDAELKILLGCTAEEEQIALNAMNNQAQRAILIRRFVDDLAVLYTRRSQRRFLPDPIPQPLLTQILEAATWAPSAHNRQPWRFAIVIDPEMRRQLANAMGAEFFRDLLAGKIPENEAQTQVQRSVERIQSAPASIVVCLDTATLDSYPDAERQAAEQTMGIQGVAMAGQNLLLAANLLGLTGVWMCAPLFCASAVRQVLVLPESWSPQGLVLLGFPTATPRQKAVKPLAEVTRYY